MLRLVTKLEVNNLKKIIEILHKCILFKGFTEQDIEQSLKTSKFLKKEYKKAEIVAIEGDNCSNIGIVLSGSIEIQRIYESGRVVVMERLNEGNIFGEVIIFSDYSKYPATIMATEKSEIMYISKENILALCKDNICFLNNFMGLLSKKILMLNKKIKSMSYKTIAQKISNYIIEEHRKQKAMNIKLNHTKKEIADMMGIPRPSLSRELINLREKGLIDFHKDEIKILDIDALEEILL